MADRVSIFRLKIPWRMSLHLFPFIPSNLTLRTESKKLKAYANIQVDIGRHLDLGERDELLDSAKKKLITESGNALG